VNEMVCDCLKAKWFKIMKENGWKGYFGHELRAFELGYNLHRAETELLTEPLALAHSVQLAELEQKVETLKVRLDATSRLLGPILTDKQIHRIIINLLIDDKMEKIIREKYPEFVDILRNRANILKRLKEHKVYR